MEQIINDYYRFDKVAEKAKTRLDCVKSTKTYPNFEEMRRTKERKPSAKLDGNKAGALIANIGDVPEYFKADPKRKADKMLSMKSEFVSSIYVPDPAMVFGYGDTKKTPDALLFVFDNFKEIDGEIQGSVEVFVCRGQAHNKTNLYTQLTEGFLDEEMEAIRSRAVEE